MAEIKPIKGWRYNKELQKEIEDLTSPLFDVVSAKQREALYKNELNSIHLSVPQGPDAAEKAKERLQKWKEQGIIEQDPLPGIYVYYQYFTLPGSNKEYIRKGFIAFLRAYDWEDGELLRHENTIPKSVNDRIDILEKTQMNVSATHGLYTDHDFELEEYMDEAMKMPLSESEDYQGVREVLSVIHDAKIIKKFIEKIADQKIILADGHHRYEGSMLYRQQMIKENPNHTGEEGYNFHMMYFTNSAADDLRILPTHRLIQNLPDFNEAEIMQKLEEDFHIKAVENASDIHEVILGKKWAFGLLFKDKTYKIRLKPESIDKLEWPFPDVVKQLDLTVMHYFFIEKILGIAGKEQRRSENIAFERNFFNCLTQVQSGEANMALITKEISMEQVREVCFSGYTMPQKSTYFYPKTICGFLFSSIKEDEFSLPPYFRL
ncbi:DUF1015 domain-containing protein [Marivirga atlantica]|jgi:uncharacterized protein (DUF1015 family)|uniref:DUF1015 domain-containing protein n=1 Tax=Marivirga atlantica TaxID=1548457 RepID=A0A937ADH8_9BACT|nr:DUF1015 domain-containing protein [Marivirga atlantica]MBL0764686.1 DUF1015 domain-containing protein [Marivirga atlantica]